MAASGLEYVELNEEQAASVDLYLSAKDKKSTHDSKSRNLGKTVKEALADVEAALGECRIGRLPDGRVVHLVIGDEQHRKANAYSFTPKSLTVDPA